MLIFPILICVNYEINGMATENFRVQDCINIQVLLKYLEFHAKITELYFYDRFLKLMYLILSPDK